MLRHSRSIRWHLSVFGTLIIVPLIVVGVAVSFFYARADRAKLQNFAEGLAAAVTDSIDKELLSDEAALQILSTSENLANERFEEFFIRAKQLTNIIPDTIIALRHPDGTPIFVTSVPFGATLSQISETTLLSAHRKAIETGKIIVTDLFVGSNSKKPFVAIVQPIFKDGSVKFLLSLGITPKRVHSILDRHLQGSDWLIGVTDNNDRIIARSWDNERYAGQRAAQQFIDNTQGQSGNFISTTLDGVSVFNFYRRSALTGWRIVAAIPKSDFEAPLRTSFYLLALLVAVGIGTSLLLALFYGQFLIAPVEKLEQLAFDVGRNETPKAVGETGLIELDKVAMTLTSVSTTLMQNARIQQSLIDELNHRVKNTLAIIQSIAWQTRKQASSLRDFGTAFEGRLMALAKSHDALTRTGWKGAELRQIVLDACQPFCDTSRLDMEGDAIELPANAIVAFGMVLHELATNAAKYGSLSTADGKIEVSWRVESKEDQRYVHFRWKERDGPPVGPMKKQGFGSLLISSVVEHDLRGKASVEPASDGLRFEATFPLNGSRVWHS